MRSFNKVMILGNLTADPVQKETKTGSGVATFSVATNRDWKNKDGEEVNETHFHKVVAFGKLATNIVTYFKKGSQILLSGRLSSRTYLGKDAKKRYITEVVAEDFNFVPHGPRRENSAIDAETGEVTEEAIEEISKRFDLKNAPIEEVVDY